MNEHKKSNKKEKTPYQKLLGENNKKERKQFIWNRLDEEENKFK